MDLLGGVAAWLANPAHWQGSDGIPTRVGEHLVLSGAAIVVAAALALPLGVLLGHVGRGGFWAMNVANVGRALPSMALLAFAITLPAEAARNGEVLVAQADCYAIGQQVAAQNGGTLARAQSANRGGQEVCIIVVLVPGKDGQRPRRAEFVVPAN